MKYSLHFFSGTSENRPREAYRLVTEASMFADRRGFEAVWTPERHFHAFGGLYPNPAVLGAGLATITQRLKIRAGSVVPPLHDPLRIVEEWSIVDNLSGGRAGVAFAAGFHPNDFVLRPDGFARRHELRWEAVDTIRRLWRGGTIQRVDGAGKLIEVEVFPKPVQPELPMWMTAGNTPNTFEQAGKLGLNVLSSLIGLDVDRLAQRIEVYHRSLVQHGYDPGTKDVSVMLHTFVGTDFEAVKARVRAPFCNYLRSHTHLLRALATSLQGIDVSEIDNADLEDLLEMEFQRYVNTNSLMGSLDTCERMIQRLAAIGVTEVCCLLDFGVPAAEVLESLVELDRLRARTEG
jgi:phthiocerol/phenolphthiocerol synthesis type-I polyketide synthase D